MLDPEGPLSYLIFVVLLLFSAFFSSAEAALSYCNRHRIKVKAEDGSKAAKLLVKIFDKFDDSIITILIGNNIVNTCCSVLTTAVATKVMGNEGSIVAIAITTVLVVLFGEMLPKNFAKVNCDRWSMIIAYPLYFFMYLFWPFGKIFSGMIALIRKLFKKAGTEEESFTEDDFQDVIEKIEEEGILDSEESDIIQAAVDFGDILVKDVLTKRENIVGINIKDCTEEYLKDFFIKYNYSRIPIYKGNIDNIIGVLHARTYLKSLFFDKKTKVTDVMTKPYFVSPQITLDEIFEGFKQHKTHMAIVTQKGKTIGMVTMKDVLEELVSDIDESDTLSDKGGVVNA